MWLLAVVSEAYRSPSEGGYRAVQAKAHEVKSIGTSMLLGRTYVVQQVMRVQTNFTSFYQKDVTHRNMDTFSRVAWWLLSRSWNSRHTVAYFVVVTSPGYWGALM